MSCRRNYSRYRSEIERELEKMAKGGCDADADGGESESVSPRLATTSACRWTPEEKEKDETRREAGHIQGARPNATRKQTNKQDKVSIQLAPEKKKVRPSPAPSNRRRGR